MQTTIEREADFLKRVTLDTGEEAILHIEFQKEDEPDMVYRMAEYKAILQKKYKVPVRQYVIYLGSDKPKMRTELPPEQRIEGFSLKNIHDIPVNRAISSDVPEEIVLSILTDYPDRDANLVISRIIAKLQRVSGSEAEFNKCVKQLITLGRIRNLEEEIGKQIEAMPITYNIENDYLYNKGAQSGMQKGMQSKTETVIRKMLLHSDLTLEQIADFADTTVEFVLKVKAAIEGK